MSLKTEPMLEPSLSDAALLKTVLAPLLDDFQFWFTRTRTLLEQERLSFLGLQAQSDLLTRIRQTQQQVSLAQSRLETAGDEAGVEVAVLTPWHQLVLECWQVGQQFRQDQAA